MTQTTISSEEWAEISGQLEIHHALFYQLWQLGKPVFDEKIRTAAVRFDPDDGSCVMFVFNPKFWESLNIYERKFVICHESLHVIYNHGLRMLDTKDAERCNIAMDVVVNHSLIKSFGFSRKALRMEEELCWIDTVCREGTEPDRSFEYYYNQLKDNLSLGSIDEHSNLPGGSGEGWDEIVEKLNESLSDEQKESIKDLLEKHTESEDGKGFGGRLAGKGALGQGSFVTQTQKKKKKWESVIKKWAKKHMKRDLDSVEQWAQTARRFLLLPDDLILPTEIDRDSWSQDRIEVWFFQDASGSCWGLKDRFFKAAKSLPTERFDVKLFSFDTRVYALDININRIRGGGGTSFYILEDYIQRHMRENNTQYPKAIFVITDGYGDYITPQVPENWYWFLSHNCDYYLPKTSNKFKLKDFE